MAEVKHTPGPKADVLIRLTNPESGYVSETAAKVTASDWQVIDRVICGSGHLYAAAPELFEAASAIAPHLGATDKNDWRGLFDDDAISMTVKIRIGDLRALRDALSKATTQQEGR